jgi:hypothetical protein
LLVQFSLSRCLSTRSLKFDKGLKMEEIEMQTMSDFSDFHQFIFEGKVEKVQRFIDSNPNKKIAMFDDSSAVAMTLKCGTLQIFEVLIANGFKLAPDEDLTAIIRNIEENPKVKSAMKVKLKEIIRKYMKESSKKHLFKLNLMSKLAPTAPEDKQQEFEEVIALTFESLALNSNIEKFMKYVASAKGELSNLLIILFVLSLSNSPICRSSNLLRFRGRNNRDNEPAALRQKNGMA